MSKIWADVTPGKLQTENRLPLGYNGEYRIRIVANLKNYCPVMTFTAMISAWVEGRQVLEYEQISIIYFEALEKVRKNPEMLKRKARLLLLVTKVGLDSLKYSRWFRKYLVDSNKYFKNYLLSPRALGSEQYQKLLTLKFKQVIIPGKDKSSFPEKAYIGVGYRDKGHSRKKELDASPSWQEIAMDRGIKDPKELNSKPERCSTTRLIAQLDWSELRTRQLRRSRKLRVQEFSLLD